jgi:hypothetical protein
LSKFNGNTLAVPQTPAQSPLVMKFEKGVTQENIGEITVSFNKANSV